MDKYYTPELEEFHVGFEFEVNNLKLNVPSNYDKGKIKDNWIPVVFDGKCFEWLQGFPSFSSIIEPLKNDRIRVKYLDKEDIESLGWKPHKEIQHYYKSPCNNFVLRIKYEGICIYIYDEYTVDKLIFEGNIKNKSELIKLLKQLNIYE